MNLPGISIIMPTFNSERTIELSLRSIRAQRYPQELVEILVLDGGSEDRTIALARAAHARVVPNPRTQQEYAKHIGLLEAKGQIAVFLDSDEQFENEDALMNRVHALREQPGARTVMSGGYRKPPGSSSANDYINIFGDPFSWFMYGLTSEWNTKIASWSTRFECVLDRPGYAVFEIGKGHALPLVDYCAGNAIDLEWFRQEFAAQLRSEEVVPALFYLIAEKAGRVPVLKNDAIIHHSSDSFVKLVRKLRWRALVNIHYPGIPGTGFANREEFHSRFWKLKKYLFIPYVLTAIGPLAASLRQFVKTGKLASWAHFPLSLITLFWIVCYYGFKIIGYRPVLKTYGTGSKNLQV